jgi:phosphoserine phosphatase RsbU/P
MITRLLSSLPLFSTLPPAELELLANSLQTRQYPAGKVLFEEGEVGLGCFLVQDGQVEIIKSLGTSDERVLAVRECGTILGEMSLFTSNRAHTASVRARTPLTLLELSKDEFDALLHRQPALAYGIATTMSQRLEQSENQTILELRQKNLELTRAYEELKDAQEQIVIKEVLEKELHIARIIQQSILPQEIPHTDVLQCGALMVPARAIGGDFYDFIQFNNNQIGIAVGDVSDKGVPAALLMAVTYSLVRAEAAHSTAPGDILRRVNRHLLDINASDMFVTLLYGVLDMQSGLFSYARAGHPTPVLANSLGKALPVPFQLGQALGLLDEPVFDEQQLGLPPDSLLLLFSDGLTEAMNQQGDDFGTDRLEAILAQNPHEHPQLVCQKLWQAVQAFSYGIPQSDDFTVAALQWGPGGIR